MSLFLTVKKMITMDRETFFTEAEKKEFFSKYRQLVRSLYAFLHKEDIRKMKELMQHIVAMDCYGRDKNGINGLLRNIDTEKLEEGKDYPMTFAVDDDVYTLHFRYLGKENKYIDGIGSIRCLKLSFEVVSGEVFSGESDLYGWFSDDENRIPVWFTAPLKIGKVQGRLRSYSELRNPFSSIVE